MALNYAWEKMYSALRGMLGGGSIKDRLIKAIEYNLVHIESKDIPEEKRDDYITTYNKLTKEKNNLSEDEALEIAQSLFDVYTTIAEEMGKKYR